MTCRRPAPRWSLLLGQLLLIGPALDAQGLTSSSGATLMITAPTEAQYDMGGPSAQTSTYTMTTSCTGTGPAGCRLFIAYGTNPQGQQVGMQWALVSATPANKCDNLPALNVFSDVVAGTVVLTTSKNADCTATVALRVNPLSYSTYQSPGPVSGEYRQQIQFIFTRP